MDDLSLLSELESIADDSTDDAIEKLQSEFKDLRENQGKFAKLIATYIKSNDKKMDRMSRSIEIIQHRGPNINVHGGKGGSATGGDVKADIG